MQPWKPTDWILPEWTAQAWGPGGKAHGSVPRRRAESRMERAEMSSFGEDLIQAMGEALAYAEGKGPALLHARRSARDQDAGQAHAGADGPADGHEPVRLL